MPSSPPPFYVQETDPPAKRAAMEAGLALFAERGIDSVTVRDIAERTGFSNPALFKHFPSKDALALALFETCYRRVLAAIVQGDEQRSLADVLAAGLVLVEEAPEAVHFVLENLRRYFRALPPALRATSILGAFRTVVRREQAAGRVAADIDVGLAAAVVIGALGQLARMHHFRELPRPPTAMADDLSRLVFKGLGA